MKSHVRVAVVVWALVVWALVACAGQDSPESPPGSATPTPLSSRPSAACPAEVNAPYGSPSMMPVEPGAPAQSGGTHIAPPKWPPEIDTVTCTKVVTAVLASKVFADRHGDHHIEVGAAGPYSETKDPDCMTYEAACWSVYFYDYDEKSGSRAVVDSSTGRPLWMKPWPGIPVSRAEADRTLEIALQDASVARAYGDGSAWWHWLYENSPGTEESLCRVNRCVSARTWKLEGGALLNVIVDLHRGQLEWVDLP
jgi:hypothetical protein